MITGSGWIKETYLTSVVYIKQKDCEFDKSKFDELLEKQDCKRTTDIMECTMKHRIGNHPEWGNNGYWQVCNPSEKGASRFFYSGYSYTF